MCWKEGASVLSEDTGLHDSLYFCLLAAGVVAAYLAASWYRGPQRWKGLVLLGEAVGLALFTVAVQAVGALSRLRGDTSLFLAAAAVLFSGAAVTMLVAGFLGRERAHGE